MASASASRLSQTNPEEHPDFTPLISSCAATDGVRASEAPSDSAALLFGAYVT